MANLNQLKKYHFLYKTTNLTNNQYYIGIHSTSNLKDGYLGSGKRLRYSVRKYGKENFKIEILEFFNNREELISKEVELVNEELINDIQCINLKCGGSGGFINKEHEYKFHAAGGRAVRLLFSKIHSEKMKHDKEYRDSIVQKLKGKQTWLGKKHKDESKKRIGEKNSVYQKGKGNSQYGTCWITNGNENKKLEKNKIIPDGWKLGRIINKPTSHSGRLHLSCKQET
jgi:hypothetical protein